MHACTKATKYVPRAPFSLNAFQDHLLFSSPTIGRLSGLALLLWDLGYDIEYLIILESIKGIEITTCGHYSTVLGLHLIKSVIFLTFLHSCRGTFLHFCFGTDLHFSSVTVLHCSFGSFLQTYSSIGWDWIVLHYQMCCVNLILKSTKSTSLQTYHCQLSLSFIVL